MKQRTVTRFLLNGKTLRFPAEGDVIVEVEQIEPGFHVLACVIELGDAPGEHLERFNGAVRAALGNVGRRLSSQIISSICRTMQLSGPVDQPGSLV
jgi:hypothetical protein